MENLETHHTDKVVEEKLPELELELIAKSLDNIGNKENTNVVLPWRDYTIYAQKNLKDAQIFNDKLQVVMTKLELKESLGIYKTINDLGFRLNSTSVIYESEYIISGHPVTLGKVMSKSEVSISRETTTLIPSIITSR